MKISQKFDIGNLSFPIWITDRSYRVLVSTLAFASPNEQRIPHLEHSLLTNLFVSSFVCESKFVSF